MQSFSFNDNTSYKLAIGLPQFGIIQSFSFNNNTSCKLTIGLPHFNIIRSFSIDKVEHVSRSIDSD